MRGKDARGAALLAVCCGLLAGCSPEGGGTDNGGNGANGAEAVAGLLRDDGAPQYLQKVPVVVRHDGRAGGGAADTRLSLEIALTQAEQEKGLMHRRSLGRGEGMLFPVLPPRAVSFWMKGTPFSLDLLFVRPDGRIARVAEKAKPGDATPIFADEPVAAVLELRGGDARALGIGEGDRVSWGRCTLSPGARASEAASFCPPG
ncbi:hypothetical protein GCM10007897_33300 [Sphingobium jiangsuense]|uniref:DUF192 domain-containing protein n=1 Tax=Sphingobium jiangsuense TaxID=870476 RepID=A0A7W6FQ37_9SPHN|nr:DUF192 domain-containing protein [Sphingobium jiangsuense]MBB3926490.1 hypothetical protein [Sphingobium jiangsuense]GLT01928.1 hypothetical protein GCM10007897_33300 [Sphingobium jiangsuense]